MEISLLIGIPFFAFFCSKLGTFLTIQKAKQQQLFEENNARKVHLEQVAALGGIPIFIALCLSALVFINSSSERNAILFDCFLLLGVGLWDDLKNIGIKRRLFTQFFVANIAYLTGFQFIEMGMHPFLTYGLTVLFIIIMINGMNFLDGINGLAGGIGLITASIFAVIFYANGYLEFAFFALAYMGALLGFLTFNFGKKAAIFMGDNGSTILGFLLAIFALKSWHISNEMNIDLRLITISLTLIALPILDLFGVVIVRLSKKQSPFQADRKHIHHLLIDNGKSHPEACYFIFVWLLGLVTIFYFEWVVNLPIASVLIVGSYVAIRFFLTAAKSPSISVAKWGKPVPQPSPTA